MIQSSIQKNNSYNLNSYYAFICISKLKLCKYIRKIDNKCNLILQCVYQPFSLNLYANTSLNYSAKLLIFS